MQLKESCELQAFMHINKTYLVITRIKARELRYVNDHEKSTTFHWMTPDYWAEYEVELQKIFNDYKGEEFEEKVFHINPLIRVQVKNASIQRKVLLRLLNIDDKGSENVSLMLECIVEYSDDIANNAINRDTHEEYQPEGNGSDSYVKYIPAKKQKRTPSKLEKEPYEIVGSSPEKNYTPSPIKKRKGDSDDKSKKNDDILTKYITKKEDVNSSSKDSSASLRRSARSPAKRKAFIDYETEFQTTKKKGLIKRSESKSQDGNNNANRKFLEWKGKIPSHRTNESRGDRKTPIQKTLIFPEKKKIAAYKPNEEGHSDNVIPEYPSNEELEEQEAKLAKQLKNSEKISEFLDKNLEPSPQPVEFMPLHQLKKEEVLLSFAEFKREFDDILIKLENKSYIKDYNGLNHFTVMGLISNHIESEMMMKLGETYDRQLDCRPKIQIYTNALLPEWTVRLFMKIYRFSRSEAIEQIIAQKKYKQYKEAESNDFYDLF